MPKKIGSRYYAHGSYINKLPVDLAHDVVDCLLYMSDIISNYKWNCVRIKMDLNKDNSREVAFQYAPDFDRDDEPQVVHSIICIGKKSTWELVDIHKHKNTIWHHKWLWVDENYKGFDYAASKQRSATWKPHVQKHELPLIGNKRYWDSIKDRWE